MRVALIGQQDFGKAVFEAFLARGDTVAGVFCAPEKPGAKPDPLRAAAAARGVTLFQLESLKTPEALAAITSLDADIGIMAYVLQFVPQPFTRVPRHGTIQYHPSLLPRHRGPSSINWPIILGEERTGLTIFRPSDGLDEGPVVLQRTVPIGPDDTLGSLYFERLFPLGIEAMLEAADHVCAGRATEVAQDEAQASYEGWCRAPEAQINWNAHIDQIYNLVRGCNPAPGAWTRFGGRTVQVFDARKHGAPTFGSVRGKTGECAAIGAESIEVSAPGGRLEIVRVRPEGGAKMPAAQFCAEAGLKVGAILGA